MEIKLCAENQSSSKLLLPRSDRPSICLIIPFILPDNPDSPFAPDGFARSAASAHPPGRVGRRRPVSPEGSASREGAGTCPDLDGRQPDIHIAITGGRPSAGVLHQAGPDIRSASYDRGRGFAEDEIT